MNEVRHSLLRDILALVIVAVASPIAVYGGSAAGCIGAGGFEFECAINGVWIAPLMLLGAGVVAGLVTRGWTGLLIVFTGTVIGMTSILGISSSLGVRCRWTGSRASSRRSGSSGRSSSATGSGA